MEQKYIDKLNMHLNIIELADTKSELIDLDTIYDDYGRPKYKSPRSVLCHRTMKEWVQCEIEKNNMEVDKVISYKDGRVYTNYNVAVHYLYSIEPRNAALFIDRSIRTKTTIYKL